MSEENMTGEYITKNEIEEILIEVFDGWIGPFDDDSVPLTLEGKLRVDQLVNEINSAVSSKLNS